MFNADHVKCNNCGEELYVPMGAETCPKCSTHGVLSFIDEENPTVVVDKDQLELLVFEDVLVLLQMLADGEDSTLKTMEVLSTLKGVEYCHVDLRIIGMSSRANRCTVVKCADGDFIIYTDKTKPNDSYDVTDTDALSHELKDVLIRNLSEYGYDVEFLENLDGMVACDECADFHKQGDLINIDPQDFRESSLMEKYRTYDGMVCKKCHKKMIKFTIPVTYYIKGEAGHKSFIKEMDIEIDPFKTFIDKQIYSAIEAAASLNIGDVIIVKDINKVNVEKIIPKFWHNLVVDSLVNKHMKIQEFDNTEDAAETDKSIYCDLIQDVVIPHKLEIEFVRRIDKFGKYSFYRYLIDEDDLTKVSKYSITIKNLRGRMVGADNVVYSADFVVEVIDKHIDDEEIIKKTIEEHSKHFKAANFSSFEKYMVVVGDINGSIYTHLTTPCC